MTARLDPITKAQRREARSVTAYTTARHAEHAQPTTWEETWCRHCRRAYLERRIAQLDGLLDGAR